MGDFVHFAEESDSWHDHRGLEIQGSARQLQVGVADVELINRLPVVGLAAASRFFSAQKVSNGEQAAVVAILVDAQALLRLSDRRTGHFDLLAVCILIVVSLPDFETDGIAGRLFQRRNFFRVWLARGTKPPVLPHLGIGQSVIRFLPASCCRRRRRGTWDYPTPIRQKRSAADRTKTWRWRHSVPVPTAAASIRFSPGES